MATKDVLTQEQIEERARNADDEKRRERGDFVEEGGDDDVKDDDGEQGDDAEAKGKAEDDGKAAKAAKAADKEDDDTKGEELGPVPYARFREVLTRAETERDRALRLEGENRALKERPATAAPAKEEPKPVDLTALRKAKNAALIEGDEDKAAELDTQIDAEVENRATARALATFRQERAVDDLNATSEQVIKAYPFLDSNSATANEEAIENVIALRDTFARKGLSPAKALAKAADVLFKDRAPAKANDNVVDEVTKARDARARERGAKASLTQPPATGGVGERTSNGEIDVSKLSDAEFRKLPAEEKRKARGDFVA